MENFNDYQFFTGESMNPDGMVVLSIWKGDGPVFYYFKDGLTEEKCVSVRDVYTSTEFTIHT